MLARQFVLAGHEIVEDAAGADLTVINTCTVTHVAAQKSRYEARRARRSASAVRLLVTGCHAEVAPHEFAAADWVVGNTQKDEIPSWIASEMPQTPPVAGQPAAKEADGHALFPAALGLTRAFVKIQDGCDMHCTFCLTRIARGRSRSRPADEIVAEIRQWVDEGGQEVVLTGVHLGAYGRDGGPDLGRLVRRILRETDLPRLRLSSLEPWNFRTEWLSLWESPRLCRHLHMSLQSGSDEVLRRMGRPYTAELFSEKVALARRAVPDLAITTDVIAGFPGETDESFAQTVQFMRRIQFARAHIFPYSRRPGTPAANMPGQVTNRIKQARAAALRAVAEETERGFRASLLGQTLPVLWEQPNGADDEWSGLTDNYIRVHVRSNVPLHNRILPTRLVRLADFGAMGELVNGVTEEM
jgi:threonylcarbamoyladenosine tRNA methylthiotransferase MtaB